MNHQSFKSIQQNLTKLPNGLFYAGIVMITLSMLIFGLIGFSIRYPDEWTVDVPVNKSDLSGFGIHEVSPGVLRQLSPGQSASIMVVTKAGKQKAKATINKIDLKGSVVWIQPKGALDSLFYTGESPVLFCKVTLYGAPRSIIRRILTNYNFKH